MSRVEQVTGISVQDLSASFLRSLRPENTSPRTVETYGDAVRAFARFLKDRGMPTTVDAVTRDTSRHGSRTSWPVGSRPRRRTGTGTCADES